MKFPDKIKIRYRQRWILEEKSKNLRENRQEIQITIYQISNQMQNVK